MKKGFTLIELLATVIILAIILVIVVPQVLNIINKTKKNAFIADSLVAAKEAQNILTVETINGVSALPSNNESVVVKISDLNNKDLKKYTGSVKIQNIDDKYYSYITMSDKTFSICNESSEDLTPSKIITSSACEIDVTEEENEVNNNGSLVVEGNIIKVKTAYVNGPVLEKNMIPVKWDSDGNMSETTVDDEEWFDYSASAKKWANAKTKDGSIWVWIPRYAYQITRGYSTNSAGNIEVKYLKELTNIAFDQTVAAPVDQGNNPGSNTKFVTHPAFKFGDDELEGIWIMKFEASDNENKPASIPNVTSWRNLLLSEMFDYSRGMELDDTYGWDTTGNAIDTHMTKDVEWGAASYLSWSTYGKSTDVWVNNSSTYITGCSGNTVTEGAFAGCKNAYNTTNGQQASTTGNYYGIYDMSGGAIDRTAGYLAGGGTILNTNGYSLVKADPKYADIFLGSSATSTDNYNLNIKYYGNAVYETSTNASGSNSWNLDQSNFLRSVGPFTARGGIYSGGTATGVFSFVDANGAISATNTFRVSLSVKKGL